MAFLKPLLGTQFKKGFRLDDYLGKSIGGYAGYSLNKQVRSHSSSGGIVSAVLIYLLKTRQIQGALVSRITTKKGKVIGESRIITNPEKILDFASSAYLDIPVLAKLGEIRKFKGKLAIVGLPCHIRALKILFKKDRGLAAKIKFTIGLFCGGNCEKTLMQRFLATNKVREEKIVRITVKRGHVGGKMKVLLKNKRIRCLPFQDFNIYRMLWFNAKKACLACFDHTAEAADLSVGDIFIKEYKDQAIKHSAIICRSKKMQKQLEAMATDGLIKLKLISKRTIFKSQRKGLIFHKNLASRAMVGKLFGYKMKVPANLKKRWNDSLASLIVFINISLSEKKAFQKIMFKIPKPLLYCYVVILKYLSCF